VSSSSNSVQLWKPNVQQNQIWLQLLRFQNRLKSVCQFASHTSIGVHRLPANDEHGFAYSKAQLIAIGRQRLKLNRAFVSSRELSPKVPISCSIRRTQPTNKPQIATFEGRARIRSCSKHLSAVSSIWRAASTSSLGASFLKHDISKPRHTRMVPEYFRPEISVVSSTKALWKSAHGFFLEPTSALYEDALRMPACRNRVPKAEHKYRSAPRKPAREKSVLSSRVPISIMSSQLDPASERHVGCGAWLALND